MVRPSLLAAALLLGSFPALAQGRPGSRTAGPPVVLADSDPIGFLLEHREQLQLADSQIGPLVQLNLRFFRRKRTLQMRLDSLVPNPTGEAFGGQQAVLPYGRDSALNERVRPVYDQLREAFRAARDSAWVLLSPQQRQRADSLSHRALTGPPGGRGRPRPR